MLCFGRSKKSKDLKRLQKQNAEHSKAASAVTSRRPSETTKVGLGKTPEEIRLACQKSNVTIEDHVLPQVFDSLSVNELLKIRPVSKLWNRVASKMLRERMEGVIILQRGLGYYTKMMNASIDVPIGKIFLNILNMNERQPKTFFRTLGHSLYNLILNLEGQSISQFQQHLRFLINLKQFSINLFDANPRKMSVIQILIEDYDELLNNNGVELELPTLESLILSCEPSWKTNQPALLEQIITASPKLKNLNCKKWPFPLKNDLFHASKLENLQFLTLAYVGNATLKSLTTKKLQLKSAEFSFDYDLDGETFDKFLESVSSTLEYIKIENRANREVVFRLVVKMPRLFTLRLTSWMGPIWLDTIANKCENLLKLQLGNCNPGIVTVKLSKPNPNVKYLATCFGNHSVVSAKSRSELVKNFVKIFPNVRCFMMKQLCDKTIGQIVNGWPSLKTLRITSGFGMTDSGLTGIPVAELSKMTKLENKLPCGCCLPFPVIDSKPSVEAARQYAWIGSLTDLVDLSIESEEGSHFPLTNFSLHLGIHALTKLQSLKITCHNGIGPHWCLKNLSHNLVNLKELTVMDRAISHDRYEEHEVLYLLRKLPNLKLNLIPTTVSNVSGI